MGPITIGEIKMGIQVTYDIKELSKLPAEGLTRKYSHTRYTGPYFSPEEWVVNPTYCAEQEARPEYNEEVFSYFFDGVFIGYEMNEEWIYFDNKRVNMEARQILDRYNVTYSRG